MINILNPKKLRWAQMTRIQVHETIKDNGIKIHKSIVIPIPTENRGLNAYTNAHAVAEQIETTNPISIIIR